MLLTINIPQKAGAIMRQSDKIGAAISMSAPALRRFDDALRDFILTIEGFSLHLSGIAQPELTALLAQTNNTITIFIGIDDDLHQKKYFGSKSIEEKFRYALKSLYRLKSFLQVESTKNKPVEKTPQALKMALFSISGKAVLSRLSK